MPSSGPLRLVSSLLSLHILLLALRFSILDLFLLALQLVFMSLLTLLERFLQAFAI